MDIAWNTIEKVKHEDKIIQIKNIGLHFVPFGMEILPYYTKLHSPVSLLITNYRIIIKFYSLTSDQNAKPPISIPLMSLCSVVGGQCSQSALSKANETVRESLFLIRREEGKTLLAEHDHQISGGYGRGNSAAGPKVTIAGGLANHFFGSSNRGIDNYSSITGGVVNGSGTPWNSVTDGILSGMGLMDNTGDFDDSQLGDGQSAGSSALLQPKPLIWLDLFHKQPWVFRLAMGSTSTGHYSITTPASQSHNGHAITTTYSKKAPYCLLDLMKFIIMSVPETLGECFAFQHYAALRRGLWRICSMCGVLTGGIPSIAMQECQHGEKQRELMLSERNEGESKEHVSAAKEKDNNWLSSAYVNENTPKFTNPSVTHKLNDTDTNTKLYNSEDISIEGNRKIISPTANLKNSTVPSIMWLDPDLLPISASDGVYDDDKYNDLTDGLIRTSLGRFYLSGNTNINVDNNSTDLLSDTATPSLVIPFGFGLCAKLIIRPSLQPATPKSSHNSLSTPSGVGMIPTFMANVTSRDEKNISDCISTQKTDRSMKRPSNSILQQPTLYDSKNGSKNKPKRNTLETFEMRLAMSYLTNTIGEYSRDRQIGESPDWTIGGESRTARLSMVASHCCSAASVLRVRDAELQRQVTLLQEIQFSEGLLGEDEQLVSEEKLTSTDSASVELLIPTPQHLLHIHRTCQTTQTHLDHFHRKIPQDQRVSATNIAKHDETGYAYAEDPRKRHHHPFYSGAWGNADVTDPSITPSDDGACNIGASKFRDATSDNDNDRGNRGSITVSIPQDYFLSLPDTSWGIFNIEREFFRQTLLGREVAENNIVGLGLNLTPFFRIMELSWGSEKDGGVVRRSCRGKVNGAAGETDGEVIEIQTTRRNDKLCQGVSPSVFSDSSIAIGDTVGVTKGVLNRSNGPSNIIRDVCIAVDCTESDTYFNPLSQYVVYSPVSNGPIKGPVKKPLHSVDGDFGNATICKSPILESSSSNSASSDNSSESSLIDILHKNISNISRDSHIIRIPSISYFKKIRSTFATYPSAIVIPRICGSLHKQFDTILSAAKFRQNGRIPSISWIHLDTGASISRCSQPMVGITGNNINDQLLCSYLNQSINSHYNQGEKEDSDSKRYPKKEREGEENKDSLLSEGRILHILDCRSSAAATANIAKGGGFELVQYYERAHIQFMSMDNIHAVRQSLEKVFKLCRATQHNDTGGVSSGALPRSKRTVLSSTSGTVGSGGVISAIGDVGDGGSGTGFFSRLESTYWPTLVQRMIWAGSQAAGYLQKGDSVLVHCTDGWDRTTQVVCIASILNDSHFRTVEGFCQLIQREWIEMGHRFAERCGHQRKVLGDFTKSMRDSLLEEAEEVLERAIDVDIERCMRKRGPKEQLRALDMVHKKGRNTLVDRKQTEETNIEKIGERCSDLSDVSITPIQDDIRCKEGVQGFNRIPSIKESNSQGWGISKYKEEKEDGSEEPISLTSKYNAVGDAENIEMLHICEETNERGMEDLKKASEEGLITEKSCEDSQLIQSQSTEDIFTSDGVTRNDRNHKQISSENCKINMFGAFASEKEKNHIKEGDAYSGGTRDHFNDNNFPNESRTHNYTSSPSSDNIDTEKGVPMKDSFVLQPQSRMATANATHLPPPSLIDPQECHLDTAGSEFSLPGRSSGKKKKSLSCTHHNGRRLPNNFIGATTLGPKMTSNETDHCSPVFILFIDGVYQLLRMFPTYFEFTPQLLIYLLDEVYSCRFGNFLMNSSNELLQVRHFPVSDAMYTNDLSNNPKTVVFEASIPTTTASIWGEIEEKVLFERTYPERVPASEKFINPFFDSKRHMMERSVTSPLIPSVQRHHYHFWYSYFCRYHHYFNEINAMCSWASDIHRFGGYKGANNVSLHRHPSHTKVYQFRPFGVCADGSGDMLTPLMERWNSSLPCTTGYLGCRLSLDDGRGHSNQSLRLGLIYELVEVGKEYLRLQHTKKEIDNNSECPKNQFVNDCETTGPNSQCHALKGILFHLFRHRTYVSKTLIHSINTILSMTDANANVVTPNNTLHSTKTDISNGEGYVTQKGYLSSNFGDKSHSLPPFSPNNSCSDDRDEPISNTGLNPNRSTGGDQQPQHHSTYNNDHTSTSRGMLDVRNDNHQQTRKLHREKTLRSRTSSSRVPYGNINCGLYETDFIERSMKDYCEICRVFFTFFNRRHTCRRCCRSVCNTCSNQTVVLRREEIGLYDDRGAAERRLPVRVCVECVVSRLEDRRDKSCGR